MDAPMRTREVAGPLHIEKDPHGNPRAKIVIAEGIIHVALPVRALPRLVREARALMNDYGVER